MISLRHFSICDATAIQQMFYPEMTIADIHEMISEWQTNTYQDIKSY